MRADDGKTDLLHEVQQLPAGEQLFVAKREGRIEGFEKEGIGAATHAIRPFTGPVKKRIAAGSVEKEPASRFHDVIGGLQGFRGKVDMLENIPEGDDIKITGATLLPVLSIDGLPAQGYTEFALQCLGQQPRLRGAGA